MNATESICLSDLAHGRSGDKGNHANVAIIAYTPQGYAWLCQHLTAEAVQHYFQPLGPSRVVRFEAPNLLALNFMLYNVLAGGASRSLRSDNQGKTLALALLRMPIERPSNFDVMGRTKAPSASAKTVPSLALRACVTQAPSASTGTAQAPSASAKTVPSLALRACVTQAPSASAGTAQAPSASAGTVSTRESSDEQ